MPSATKTKSGRIFRAPTDQARKLERKRENKKNRRDRQQIRQTIAKCCNVDDCQRKMLALERQILGLDAPQFHIDVLKKKQKTLQEMIDRRRTVLAQMKDDEEMNSLNLKMQHYYADVKKLQALAEQERMARETNIDLIPLPDGELADGDRRQVQLMGPQVVKKKVDFVLPPPRRKGKQRAPGPPPGLPPVLSDSEGEDDYHISAPAEDDLAPVPIPDFDEPRPIPRYGGYSAMVPLRTAPGPPPMPPPAQMVYNPMGIPVNPENAIISSAPVILQEPPTQGPSAPTVVSAGPQLRDLRKETVKLVPSVLKRTTKPLAPIRSKPTAPAISAVTQAAKSTDDAYNEFMKELGDLI